MNPSQSIKTQEAASIAPRRKLAWMVSLAIHATLLGILLSWYLPRPMNASVVQVDVSSADENTAEPLVLESSSKLIPETDFSDSERSDDASIRHTVESEIDQAESRSDAENLSELEKQLQRLQSVSSPESSAAAAASVAGALGLDTAQYSEDKSAESPADTVGTFDTETAQILEVFRTRDEQGRWEYETELVDDEGRRMRVAVSAAEGETLYETFEMMKRFPMAKGIYQSVVMPLLQKMLEP